MVLEKKIFKCFHYFAISPLGNGPGLSFALFEFHSPKILCAMFSCNWSSRSAEKVGNVSVYRQAEGGTHVDQESSGVQVS